MAVSKRLIDKTVDECLDARFAIDALIKTIDHAIRDGVIDDVEAAALNELCGIALHEGSEAVRQAEKASGFASLIGALERGELRTWYTREKAQNAGYDPDMLNEMAQSETAAV